MKIEMKNLGKVVQSFDSYEELIDYLNSVDSFTKIEVTEE